MTVALVQHNVATGTGTAPAASFTGATSAGNLIIVKVTYLPTGGTLTMPAGFSQDVGLSPSGPQVSIWSRPNAPSTTTVTGSLSGGSVRWVMAIEEWSGLRSASALDQTASATTATAASGSSGTTGATKQANEVAAVAIAVDDGSNGDGEFSSPTNGFTLLENKANGNPLALATLYKVVSATGAYSTAVNCSTSPNYYGVIATYQTVGTAYTSQATGNWSSSSTWTPTGVPGAGDTAVIATGTTVTVDVNTTVGGKASGIGHALTIQATNAGTYGSLLVSNGVTLTLTGFDTGNNTLMKVNQYALFQPQTGSTVNGDVASDFGSVILNQGRFEPQTGVTFGVPAANVNWNSAGSVSGVAYGPYDTTGKTAVNGTAYAGAIASVTMGQGDVSNGGGTGLGSAADSSLSVSASGFTLTTQRTSLAAIASAGDYYFDYDTGILYVGMAAYVNAKTISATYKKLDRSAANWRGWGVYSYGAQTGCTCLVNGCTFQYMGASGAGLNNGTIHVAAPITLVSHQTPTVNSSRNGYVKNSTFNYGFRHVQLATCTGANGDPILVAGNTFNEASGGTFHDGVTCYQSGAQNYLTVDSNAFNTRGYAVWLNGITGDHQNVRVTNNTGVVASSFVYGNGTQFQTPNSYFAPAQTPALYVGGNSVRGMGEPGIDGRFFNIVGGTSGNTCVVENNLVHHCLRLGHLGGSYVTFRNNIFSTAYHHGFTGSNLDDQYVTDVDFHDNLFVCDRGTVAGGSFSTSAAIQCGYNHRCTVNNLTIYNNTFDGWLYGAIDFSDIPDNTAGSGVLATNMVVANNVIANGAFACGVHGAANIPINLHVLEFDYDNVNGQATAFSSGLVNTTTPTGFYQGGSKYNRLASGSRNIPGVALFDPSYTTAQSARPLVYTVNTLGQDHTLTWGSGSPVQLVYDYGTSSGGGTRTLGCTGKSTWSANNNSIRTKWLWVVSGTGAGQARAITWATANTAVSVTIANGGGGYTVGTMFEIFTGVTVEAPGAYPLMQVTSVSSGVVTGVAIVSGGTCSAVPSNPAATTRLNGAGAGLTLNITWAPGLLFLPDLSTPLDATSVFAIVNSEVSLGDGASGTVNAGLYLPNPSSWQTAVQLPTTTQTDTGITVTVNKSPTGSPSWTTTTLTQTPSGYAIGPSSAARGAGTTDNAASTDYFGHAFASPPSMGFAEYVATGGIPAMWQFLSMGGGFQTLAGPGLHK